MIASALAVEGDFRAWEGWTPLRQPVRLEPEDAALRVRRDFVVDRAVLELEQEAAVDLVLTRLLCQLTVPYSLALGRSNDQESAGGSLLEPNPDRCGLDGGRAQE
jgi:hypothetical protein